MTGSGLSSGFDSSYDAVVVGAGNGGLCAALALAVKGAKPLLLEQHNLPGGFATSFVRGRFEFEASLHELSDVGPDDNRGGVRKFFEDEAGIFIDWVRVPEAYRIILPDQDINVRLPFGEKEYIDAMAEAVPGSRKSIEEYIGICRDTYDVLGFLSRMAAKPDPLRLVSDFTDLLKESGRPAREVAALARKAANFIRTMPSTAQEVIDSCDIPEKAVKILSPYWCYLGIPMNRLAHTHWGAMLISYLEKGAYLPRNRSQEMANALDARIRELGGDIQYNTRVEKILVKNGRVHGVETSRGETIQAKHIISNVSPTLVYNRLVHPQSEVPGAALKYVNAHRHASAGFVVYMGLDVSAEELGLDDYTYFIADDMDTENIYGGLDEPRTPDMQATTSLNTAIPDCSPEGTCILSITTLFRPEAWRGVQASEYFRLKNEIAGGLITQFEKATGIGVRDHIEEIEVATPATFARYTRTYAGVVYGYEPDVWDSPLPRVISSKDEKFIDGLEFAGGFSIMGHGYSPSLLSGREAGYTVAAKLGG